MPTVLAVAPGTPPALQGRHLLGDQLAVEVAASPEAILRDASARVFDLLVLAGMTVEQQQRFATAIQQERRWRLVPILYVMDPTKPGFAVPGCFRPEIDGLARGTLESPEVRRRMKELAREGTSGAELVIAGPFELDPIRGVLRLAELEIPLTERECEILAILLARPNRTVTASEIIERSWGVAADERHLQILRRHVSNIRRKLHSTAGARNVRTVRGSGYRFEVRQAG
ncbi:MAG: winged helix-turn-helix domain-containing protein [Hyphomicrobiales bacterium]